ncbi:MAG: hypothetical protein H6648_06045 [Caldilineae bacterium]|nr:hypothetical protein [Chloroflexota bacterium]MCB9176707.1 hypothetical protein [Caldilineae bacterium]
MAGLFDRLQQDLEQREKMAGISPVDLLDMPDDLRTLVLLLSRKGELPLATLCELAGLTEAEATHLLGALEEKGFVLGREIKGVPHYRTYFGQRRRREVPLDIWASLSELTKGEGDDAEDPADARSSGPSGATP